jgi:hypothetical protein
MDRRERRRRKRREKRIDKQIQLKGVKPPYTPSLQTAEASHPRSVFTSVKIYFNKLLPRAKFMWGIIAAVAVILGVYETTLPRISIEPGTSMDTSDAFSTEFQIKNDNQVFSINGVRYQCMLCSVRLPNDAIIRNVPISGDRFIPEMKPNETSTIECHRFWYSGTDVIKAVIGFDISYRPDWWPLRQAKRYWFLGSRDSQNVVHWSHRANSEMP